MHEPELQSVERDAWVVGALATVVLAFACTGDVGFGDSGEIGGAAVLLGVAHPTGFAVDLLWLKAVSLLPLGPLGFRLNLATALSSALALGLLAALTGLLAVQLGVRRRMPRRVGVLAAVSALAGFEAWMAAARSVEVYALGLAAVLFALYALAWPRREQGQLWTLIGFSPGLHVTAGLYALLLASAHAVRVAVGAGVPRALRWVLAHSVVVPAGALVIAYLPLASHRDPAIDWGDPESAMAVIGHLTAARIRSAYAGDMLGGKLGATLELGGQLAELSTVAATALLAAALLVVRVPARVLGLAALGLLLADVSYGVLLNPMGVADHQVGHTAGACLALLGGAGLACLLELASTRRVLYAAACAIGLVAGGSPLLRVPVGLDDYAASELLGSGGPLATLPARSVLLCSNDDACSTGWFAVYAELARPDLDVAPAQHLWDPTVLRLLEHVPSAELRATQPAPEVTARRAAAQSVMRELMQAAAARPVVLETTQLAQDAGFAGPLLPLAGTSYAVPAERAGDHAFSARLQAFDARREARLPSETQLGRHARGAWSRAYGEIGAMALRATDLASATRALEAAVAIAPERAAAWSNLGVARAQRGDLAGAIADARRAIALEPARATPWVNLVRWERARGNAAQAKALVQEAAQRGVRDRRLDALRAELSTP